MPLPKWLARFNKRTFNKMELRRGVRPVVTHVGRSSGRTYQTPLDAHPIDGGYLFILNYGPDSDWVRNIMAAGTAHLTIGEDEYDLVNPQILDTEQAFPLLPEGTKTPPSWVGVNECLRMDLAEA